MKRGSKILVLTLSTILLLVLLAVTMLAAYDWNRIKPWLSQRVSEASDRSFEIRGDLRLSWHRQQSDAGGWQAYVPWPHFRAEQVVVGNPDWSKTQATMANIERVEFSINPLRLPEREIAVPTLVLTQADLVLERAADGRSNWIFKAADRPGAWKLDLGRIELNNGQVRLVDGQRKADITAHLQSLAQVNEAGHQLRWSLKGKLEGESVTGSGQAGPLLALREQNKPYPLDAELKVGSSKLSATGSVTRPRSLAEIEVRLELSGPSLAKLTPVTTVLLPETAPYSTRGHLKGKFNNDDVHWVYEDFSGKIGASDVSGTLAYQGGKPRPRLEGSIVSKLLRFQDLGPIIGSSAGNRTGSVNAPATKADAGQVLPNKLFRSDRWDSLDAEVKITGRQIIRSAGLPIENLNTQLSLKDGVLSLHPLNFGVAGGSVTSDLRLDGRGPQIQAQIKANVRKLQLKRMFPAVDSMQASAGMLNGDANLTGTGDSVASLLGSASGDIRLLMDHGTVSKLLLETAGLNVGSMIVTRLFGDEQVDIHCMISDFSVDKGLMKTRAFVIDTEDAIITVDGTINLAREQLKLVINPQSRNIRLLSLRSPLYVTGSFRKPSIDVDKGVLAAKAGGAIVLGVLAPLATAMLPLINTGEEQESGCRALLNQIKEASSSPAKNPPPNAKRAR